MKSRLLVLGLLLAAIALVLRANGPPAALEGLSRKVGTASVTLLDAEVSMPTATNAPEGNEGRHQVVAEELVSRRRALPLFGEKGPPDWVVEGTGILVVEVFDRTAGSPANGFVDLWRVDAPGNEAWSRGDQRQQRESLVAGQAEFHDLASGTYRVFIPNSTVDSPDPAAFEVTAGRTRVSLQVTYPRRFRLYVDICGIDGVAVQQANIDVTKLGGSHETLRPRWLKARRQLGSHGLWGGGGGASSRRRLRGLKRSEEGFFIREVSEPALNDSSHWRVHVETSGGGTASGVIPAAEAIDQTVTVVVLSPTRFASVFVDELGGPIEGIAGHITIKGGVVIGDMPRPWVHAVFDVSTHHPKMEPHTFRWRASDGTPRTQVLRARS